MGTTVIYEIETQPVKSQQINVTVSQQPCSIMLTSRNQVLYFSLEVEERQIVTNVPCLYANRLIRYEYLGFVGDFYFIDLEGNLNPSYEQLGGRFKLYYVQ